MQFKIYKLIALLLVFSSSFTSYSQCTHCSTPLSPSSMGYSGSASYYKGAQIQLWIAPPSVTVDAYEWYRVLGTDTAFIGNSDTMAYVADTTCSFIARSINHCTCVGSSAVTNYYSPFAAMGMITVVNTANYPQLSIQSYVQTVCSGSPTDIVISSALSSYRNSWTRNNTVNVSGSNGTTFYNGGSLPVTLTNNTSSPQTVRFLFYSGTTAGASWVNSDCKSFYVTVMPSAAPSGNHCFIPSVPHHILNSYGAYVTNAYKGSTIQLLADSTVTADSVLWYKVVRTDTTYAGQGYSLGITTDTTCLYLARNVNVCNCSSQSAYYGPLFRMDSFTIVAGTPTAFSVTNYMPTVASGTQIDIVPLLDSLSSLTFTPEIYLDNAYVKDTGTGGALPGISVRYVAGGGLSAYGIKLTNTTTVPQLVRYWFTSASNASGNPLGNTVSGYFTVLPSTFTAPVGNHCTLPLMANNGYQSVTGYPGSVGTRNYIKGAVVNLDMNHFFSNFFVNNPLNVDSVDWYKVRWPGDTTYIGNSYPVNVTIDTNCMIYAVSKNVCYWSDSSKHIYSSAKSWQMNAMAYAGASPNNVTFTNNAANICSGKTTNISVSSASGNIVTWYRDNTAKVKANLDRNNMYYTFPATLIDTLTDTLRTPVIEYFGAACGITLSGKTCYGSTALTSVMVYPPCSGWSGDTIGVHPALDSVCAGTSVTMTADTLPCTGGTRYSWSSGDTTRTISKSAAGTYTVTATNFCGCTATASAVIAIRSNPSLTVTNDTICSGAVATMTATGGTHYLWSNGDSTASFTTSTAGTYTVTATNTYGCSATASGTVTVHANPTPTVNNDTICAGSTAILTASGGVSYLWSTGTTTATISTGTAGAYTVTATNIYGCTATASGTVKVNTNPVPSVNNDTVCAGETAKLTAYGGTQFLWSTGSISDTIISDTAATYSVTVTNAAGCSAVTSGNVIVHANPNPTVNSPSLGNGGIAVLTATGGIKYLWNTGDTSTSIVGLSAGSYTVTVTNIYGCSASATGIVSFSTSTTNSLTPSQTQALVNKTVNYPFCNCPGSFNYKRVPHLF